MMTERLDPRTPVLVGVGTCADDAEAVELMARATRRAGADAGGHGTLLAATERIAAPRGTWGYGDPGRVVAERIGAAGAETHLIELGIPQQTPIDEAVAAIVGGSLDVALVVGGEARARAARRARHGTRADAAGVAAVALRSAPSDPDELDQGGAVPDVHRTPEAEIVSPAEVAAELWAPVEQYALIESALRAHEGTPVEVHRRQVAELWAAMNEVARTNPEAAFGAPLSAEDLLREGAGRPLAFPYARWHASQWTVDQAAALVLCSVAAAERHGVPRARWLFPLVALESSHAVALTRRRELHRWPAMAVLGRAAEAHLGRPLRTVEHLELYSCFPSAVRVQQRELGLPLERTPTVTGGMTFAGGPFNSYVLQATAAMARRLRVAPGLGLVTTVSGFLTKPGLAVWSTAADGRPPLVGDLAVEAAAATEVVDALEAYDGTATVAAVTVTYRGTDPATAVCVLHTPAGQHVIARSDEPAVMAAATTEELVGRPADVVAGRFRLVGS